MANYSITIKMSQDTVDKLTAAGTSFYGFKAVQTNNAGGQPLVWFSSDNFGTKLVISWTTDYQAFTTKTKIKDGVTIQATNAYDIDLGQNLEVLGDAGTGKVVNGTVPLAIGINNKTSTEMVCGISQMVKGDASPLCAFPLYGNYLDLIVPIQKVALMPATQAIDTGSVIMQAFGQGILLDLTLNNNANVNYDINAGWSNADVTSKKIDQDTPMAPLLITRKDKLASRHAELVRELHTA